MFFPFNILMEPIRPLMRSSRVSYRVRDVDSERNSMGIVSESSTSLLESRSEQIQKTSM